QPIGSYCELVDVEPRPRRLLPSLSLLRSQTNRLPSSWLSNNQRLLGDKLLADEGKRTTRGKRHQLSDRLAVFRQLENLWRQAGLEPHLAHVEHGMGNRGHQ